MQPDNQSYKKVFESIWKIEKAVLETVDLEQSTKKVVNIILTELGNILTGYEVIVLTLLDEKEKTLKRIAISNTDSAQKFLSATPIPFNDIIIPLWAQQNLSVRAINERKMFVSESVSEVLVPAIDREWVDDFQKTLGIKTSIVYPVIAKDKVLGTLIFSLSKPESEIKDEEWSILESFVGAVGIALDNALLFRSLDDKTKELEQANIRLEELDKLKDEFVSLASHELRTPMTIIKDYTSEMIDENKGLDDKNKERLSKIHDNAQRLIAIVNDNLDVSRIESGAMEFKPTNFDISALSVEVRDELSEKYLPKQIKLEVMVGNFTVFADKDKIRQVLINLMDNAIKFTPEKGIIEVLFKANDKNIMTTVSDSGTGIKQEDLKKLFAKFERLQNTVSGTGLGLYLSKKIVEKSGGTIGVESLFGKGSKFFFTLPSVVA